MEEHIVRLCRAVEELSLERYHEDTCQTLVGEQNSIRLRTVVITIDLLGHIGKQR